MKKKTVDAKAWSDYSKSIKLLKKPKFKCKVKKIKGWIEIGETEPKYITFKKPTKKDKQWAKVFGNNIYECEITYKVFNLP